MAHMSRRDFITKNATAAMALYLASCTSARLKKPNPIANGQGLSNKDVNAVFGDLSKMVKGSVMRVGDSGYQSAISIDNGRVRRSPFLVVAPMSTEDIANTVKYCRAHHIRLTTKSGGHSAAGYCLNSEGVVLDLSKMNMIQPLEGGEILSVGSGTRWIQVYDHVQQNHGDKIPIGGGCAGVGVAGFLLGGGYSFISRSHGMGCDNVKAMEFVYEPIAVERFIYRMDTWWR